MGAVCPQKCVVGTKFIVIFIFLKQVYWSILIVWKYAMVSTMVKDGLLNLIQIPNQTKLLLLSLPKNKCLGMAYLIHFKVPYFRE